MKKKSIIIALGIALTGLIAVAAFYGAKNNKAPSNTRKQLAEKWTNSPKEDNGRSRHNSLNLDKKRQKLRNMSLAIAHTAGTGDTDEKDTAPTEEEEAAHTQAQWKKIDSIFFSKKGAVIFDKIFDKETQDPNWTQSIQRYAESVLTAEKYRGSSVEKVDCRQKLCKVEVFHIDELDMNRFKNEETITGPWEGDQYGTTYDLENGAKKTVFYFSRQGIGNKPFKEFRNHLEKMVDENAATGDELSGESSTRSL